MNEEKKGGRKPKLNPAVFRYTVNFDAVEHARFLTLFEQSGLQSKSQFIAARVFSEDFRIFRHQTHGIISTVPCCRSELQSGGEGTPRAFLRKKSTSHAL